MTRSLRNYGTTSLGVPAHLSTCRSKANLVSLAGLSAPFFLAPLLVFGFLPDSLGCLVLTTLLSTSGINQNEGWIFLGDQERGREREREVRYSAAKNPFRALRTYVYDVREAKTTKEKETKNPNKSRAKVHKRQGSLTPRFTLFQQSNRQAVELNERRKLFSGSVNARSRALPRASSIK